MTPSTSGRDPLAVVVVAVTAVVGVVWAGAAVAALMTGELLRAGASAAVVAAVRLPSRLSAPASAWPAAAARQLPGPWLYWPATAVVAAVAAALGGWVWSTVVRRPGLERRRRLGVRTEARLATPGDLEPLVVPGPLPGRLVLGTVGGRLVATEVRATTPARRSGRRRGRQGDRSAVAVIGPARCGKTANTIAGILEWDGPAILSSVKSDLLGATINRRRAVGEVKVFDPTASVAIPTAGWSPLRDAGNLPGAQRAARALVDAGPKDGAENIKFFSVMAEQLLWPLLFAAAAGGRSMTDVVRWVMRQDRPANGRPGEVVSVLDALLVGGDEARRAEASFALTALESTWRQDDRTRSGAYATAKTLLRAWEDPIVAASAAGQDISLEWLLAGANTLYVCMPVTPDEHERLAAVLGGLLGDLLQQAYARVNRTGVPLPNLLLVMDEAGNTPTRWLPAVASTCAGIGILLVTIWQSLAQVNALYGAVADSVLTNHGTKVIFSGVSDAATLDYAVRLLGHEEVLQRAVSADDLSRRSMNESTTRRELVPADVLRMVAPFEALLVHGTLPPAHLHARPYYLDRRLRRLAAGD